MPCTNVLIWELNRYRRQTTDDFNDDGRHTLNLSFYERAVSIFVQQHRYIKNAYSHAESFRHLERFLKKTALLSNLIPPCVYYLTNLVSVSYPPVFLIPRSM